MQGLKQAIISLPPLHNLTIKEYLFNIDKRPVNIISEYYPEYILHRKKKKKNCTFLNENFE